MPKITSKTSKNISKIPKNNSLTLEQKVLIINRIEKGEKQIELAKLYNVTKSTVSKFYKNRKELKKRFEIRPPESKRLKVPLFENLDLALLEWFKIQRNQNIPLSGPILLEKAHFFAEAFGYSEFKGSEGWLANWKKRNLIANLSISGSGASVDEVAIENWICDQWPLIASGYEAKDIFNADETGLFYQMLPNKTLAFKGEKCIGGKQSKERISVLFCCNSDGSEKLPVLVIGKSNNPRPFKKFKKENLPVKYKFNKKAWMTQIIFEEWLKEFNEKMKRQNRNILLTLDNCSAHPKNIELSNIKLVYFPPNATSKIQPLDQGIIQNFKCHYRRIIITKLLRKIEKNLEVKIDLLEAILALNSAWIKVRPKTISNCFAHANIVKFDESFLIDLETEELDDEWNEQFEMLKKSLNIDDETITLDLYVSFDNDLITSSNPTDYDTFDSLMDDGEEEEEIAEEELNETGYMPIGANEALDCIEKLKLYFLGQPDKIIDQVDILTRMENCIIINKMREQKQKKITDFFSKS